MAPVITVKNIDDPRLTPYRFLKGKDLKKQGIFIAEGTRVVKELLKGKFRILSFLTTGHVYKKLKKTLRGTVKSRVPVYIGETKDLAKITGFRFHQGILASAKIPEKRTLTEIAKKIPRRGHLLVAFNSVTDPQNVGLIVRNAGGFGADAIIVDKRTCDPYYRKSVRVSIGAIFKLPVAYEDNLPASLRRLKKNFNTKIIATSPGYGTIPLEKCDFSGNVCLVFGNEGEGLSREILKLADRKVKIPLSSAVDSLNVACSSTVFLYKAALAK